VPVFPSQREIPSIIVALHLVFLVLVSCKGSLIATGRYIIANDHNVKAATSGISLLVTNKLDRDEKRMQL